MARIPERPAAPPANAPKVAEEDIRRRAYELYQERARRGQPGSPVDDWARAEREVRNGGTKLRR